jgi:hypothetical protein
MSLLWAVDAGDLIAIAIVILFFVVPAVLQLLSKLQGPPRPPAGRRPAARPPARPAPKNVQDEIADFLRRAAQGRAAGAPPPRRPAARPVQAQPVREVPVEAEVLPGAPLGQEMRDHVRQYLDSADFARQRAELGRELTEAEDLLAAQLQEKFGHELGRLGRTPRESAAGAQVVEAPEPDDRIGELPPTAAVGLPALLATAEGLQQAIIIHEIIERPEHRWG